MKLPRITVRRLMILVAVVALGLSAFAWCLKMKRLSDEYSRRASSYPRALGPHPYWGVFGDERSHSPHDQWEDAMVSKYRHAARYPWLPVAPDPPEPQ